MRKEIAKTYVCVKCQEWRSWNFSRIDVFGSDEETIKNKLTRQRWELRHKNDDNYFETICPECRIWEAREIIDAILKQIKGGYLAVYGLRQGEKMHLDMEEQNKESIIEQLVFEKNGQIVKEIGHIRENICTTLQFDRTGRLVFQDNRHEYSPCI